MDSQFFKLPKQIKEKQSLQRKLFYHMFVLVAILLLFFVMFLVLFGHFTSTEKKFMTLFLCKRRFLTVICHPTTTHLPQKAFIFPNP